MSSQGFSFPPPPPPPPTSQQPAGAPSAQHGHWNGRGAGGRGRGRGNRGRGGGGRHHQDNGRSSFPNTTGYNYPPGNYGYPAQPTPATSYMTTPPYPHQQPNFQHPPNPPPYQSPQPFSQPAGAAAYQPLPGYNNPNIGHSTSYSTPPTTPYPAGISTHQHASPPPNPMIMGSMPWGPEVQASPGSYGVAPPGHRRGSWSSHSHGNHGPKSRNHHKRDHSSAFNKPQSTVPRTPAAPAVPSFGNPLPSKPPPAADATRKPKKRKRKHNQLGLTPKTEEHESSEEEEDADEESKLAQSGSGAAPIQFTYKGQTAKLQSSSDIAAWIAERRKKFPTQARVEEKKKAWEEAKAARDAAREAARQEKEKEKDKAKQKQLEQNPNGEAADPALDEAMKAQRKADKIRRNLDREQKRFAKAEAAAEAARLKVEALQKQAQGLDKHQVPQANGAGAPEIKPGVDIKTEPSESSEGVDSIPLDATDTPKAPVSELVDTSPILAETVDATTGRLEGAMDISSDVSGPSDWTSSSGSDTGSKSDSDSGSDSDSDGDSAPQEATSRRQGPERVPPPPREGKKIRCRHFARSGHCNRGDSCQFSHEAPERGPKARTKTKTVEKGRKGLLQALLDRQKEDEDRRAMEVINWLGQNGLLGPSTSAPL